MKTICKKVMKKNAKKDQGAKKALHLNEIEVLVNIHHPHIVQLHEVINEEEESSMYLIMQYLPGKSFE
jgi:serine/threonine protein kinase